VVGSVTGETERLLLTDDRGGCPELHFAAYVVTIKTQSATSTGCWFGRGEHVVIDWVEHGRRYWPAALVTWGLEQNSKLRSPTI
jgi:hypothetical protein